MEMRKMKYPRLIAGIFAVGALVLIPWSIILAKDLPSRHLAHNWDIAWVGFDVFMITMLLLSAYFAARRSIWIIITSCSLATALLVDSWFDVLTARPGADQNQAVFIALFVEVPFALLTYFLIYQMIVRINTKGRKKY